MTSLRTLYHVSQIILHMWSCDQILATPAYLWEKLSKRQFYKNLTEKSNFLTRALGSGLIIWGWHYIWLWDLHQWGKRVKNKTWKFLDTNSYVCKSYRGKTGGRSFLPPIGLKPKTSQKTYLVDQFWVLVINMPLIYWFSCR